MSSTQKLKEHKRGLALVANNKTEMTSLKWNGMFQDLAGADRDAIKR